MPPLARPARALPVRRTIGGQSLPEAHRKRAEIGAGEDELCRVRQIERTPGDGRTTVDDRPGHGPCDRFWLREVLDRARAAGDPLEAFDLECGRDGHRARRSFMARPNERDGQRERERGDASAHQWFPDHGSRPRAGPIPPCVDFVNTEEARRHCVRGERSLPWSSFSRYEVVTRRKAAALATR